MDRRLTSASRLKSAVQCAFAAAQKQTLTMTSVGRGCAIKRHPREGDAGYPHHALERRLASVVVAYGERQFHLGEDDGKPLNVGIEVQPLDHQALRLGERPHTRHAR